MTFTRRATEVFASVDIDDNPTAPRVDYTRIWGSEIEAVAENGEFDELAIPAIRQRLRIGADLLDYGISPGTTEYGQDEIDALETAMESDGITAVFAPPGNYELGEEVTFNRGTRLIGESKSTTVFTFYHDGVGIYFSGLNGIGGGLRNLSVNNGYGDTATAYVYAYASVTGESPDFLEIVDCNFTSPDGSTVSYGLVLDGSARDGSAPNELVGIRDIRLIGCDVFNCDVASTEIRTGKGVFIESLAHNQVAGDVAKLVINGASGKESNNIYINNSSVIDVSIDWASKVFGRNNDINNVIIGSNASSSRIGVASGTVSNNGNTVFVDRIPQTRESLSGNTASRPSLTSADAGTVYFDTTLGKPIFYRGDGWVDATGTVV